MPELNHSIVEQKEIIALTKKEEKFDVLLEASKGLRKEIPSTDLGLVMSNK